MFGCGGERDRGKRPQMAAIAERLADTVIVTDDNPRSEDGDAIVADILGRLRATRDARHRAARPRRRDRTRASARPAPDDIVLIAGKGHEPYQEIDGVQHPFDDTAGGRAARWRRAA